MQQRVIKTATLTMHRDPDPISEVVSEALYGESLSVVEEKGKWSYIQTSDRYRGWSKTAMLCALSSGPPNASIESLWAHLYRVQDTTPHPPLITLPFGSSIWIEETGDPRWLRTLYHGETAWVQRGEVRVESVFRTFDQLLELARRFVGLPYRWGGRSGFGYDCSGFIQMLFREKGIALPRDISQQVQCGKEVVSTEFQIGDLLFFKGKQGVLNHGGMLVDVENARFIHSCTTDAPHLTGVKISSLKEGFWKQSFVAARRVSLVT